MEQQSSYSTDVATSLHNDASRTRRHVEALDGFVDYEEQSSASRFPAPPRSSQVDWFPRNHGGNRVTSVHGIGVHDPRHRLLVSVHVRRGNIFLGSDEIEQLRRIASRHPFKLAEGHLNWIADDAALGAAKWNVDDGTLPCHPRSQGPHFVEVNVGSETDAALRRTARKVMLNAKALEDLNSA